jgi:glucose-1-phosphate thymidylyltransferase
VKCVVLAAGYATRLYPLTEHYPKPLLDVGGRAILDWLIDDIHGSGLVDGYAVVTNHRFADHFRQWARRRGEPIAVVDDGTTDNETRLGAVRDIQFAVERQDIRGDVLVVAGDNLLDFSLAPFMRFAAASGCPCVMCYPEDDPALQRRTAIIALDGTGTITSYEEKPEKPKGSLAVPPFYYYRAEDVRRIPEALAAGCGQDAPGSFAAWLSARTPMKAWLMPGSRYDIGTPDSYARVRAVYRGVTARN